VNVTVFMLSPPVIYVHKCAFLCANCQEAFNLSEGIESLWKQGDFIRHQRR
jgi:hypothetical protein